MTRRLSMTLLVVFSLATVSQAFGQSRPPAWRFGADSQIGMTSRGVDPSATGLVIDSFLAAQWGDDLHLVARPVSRGRVDGSWHHDFYQLGLRFHPRQSVPVRIEAGYGLPVVGLGLLRSRPTERDLSSLHPQYFTPLPRFEAGLPPLWSVTPSYPLVAIVSIGSPRWDVRAGVADGSPTRIRGVIRENPPRAPQLVAGAGVTPTTGMRIGLTLVRGDYLTAPENPDATGRGRTATVSGAELEYEFGYTTILAEWIRDVFETPTGRAVASSGFVRVTHALTPRWRLAGRYDVSTPPSESRELSSRVRSLRSLEGLVAYRIGRDLVLRGFVTADRSFFAPSWSPRAGLSLAIGHRWR